MLLWLYICGALGTAWVIGGKTPKTESEMDKYRTISEILASLLWPIFWVHVIIVAVMKHAK